MRSRTIVSDGQNVDYRVRTRVNARFAHPKCALTLIKALRFPLACTSDNRDAANSSTRILPGHFSKELSAYPFAPT